MNIAKAGAVDSQSAIAPFARSLGPLVQARAFGMTPL